MEKSKLFPSQTEEIAYKHRSKYTKNSAIFFKSLKIASIIFLLIAGFVCMCAFLPQKYVNVIAPTIILFMIILCATYITIKESNQN